MGLKDPSTLIPLKANRLLNLMLLLIVLILVRVWHLAFIQHDTRLEQSRKPQRRVLIQRAERATIRDRFNLPLAINKVQYNAAISYAQIKEIPSFVWVKTKTGKREKIYKRKLYIKKLSKLLGRELDLDSERIEDLIHGKAALLCKIPFILKEEISEREYYRLKMLEKDWLGIQAERVAKRVYPKGATGADLVGYIGKINRSEFDKITQEIRLLTAYLQEYEEVGESHLTIPADLHSLTQVRQRLKELEERAYTINDLVGKAGSEAAFDEVLRGFRGKKVYYSDARGNFLRELPGSSDPLQGQRILLTISSELQEYAEQLLAENEDLREGTSFRLDQDTQVYTKVKQPWIKGGAIIVMDPNTGELLTMASYPRFNPNDFISSKDPVLIKEKSSNIYRWLENELYLAELWELKQPLKRECFSFSKGEFYEEKKELTWSVYLDFILPKNHPIRMVLEKHGSIKDSLFVQRELKTLYQELSVHPIHLINALYPSSPDLPIKPQKSCGSPLSQDTLKSNQRACQLFKEKMTPYFSSLQNNYDKLLLLDLYRLIVDSSLFPPLLDSHFGAQSIDEYRRQSADVLYIQEQIRALLKTVFHQNEFAKWREENQKNFLAAKRAQEIELKTYQKPYIDYLDKEEKEQFAQFWEHYRLSFLTFLLTQTFPLDEQEPLRPHLERLSQIRTSWLKEEVQAKNFSRLFRSLRGKDPSLVYAYLNSFRPFSALVQPLLGYYPNLPHLKGIQLEKHLAAAFYPIYGFGHVRSQAYRQAAHQGSIFKVVTAYEALRQQQLKSGGSQFKELNPLTIIDDVHHASTGWFVGYLNNGHPIPQFYKGGRLPRSLTKKIGKINLIEAMEVSSNPYFSLLAGEALEKPEDLTQAARWFSYGERTGIDLPGEIKGSIPEDISYNRTGLYSLAMGQHSLVVTPLQTAVMLSAIANGGHILKPQILSLTAGKEAVNTKNLFLHRPSFAYKESLSLVGIDFPFFVGAEKREKRALVAQSPVDIRREVFLPSCIQKILLDAMHQVVVGPRGGAQATKLQALRYRQQIIKDYVDLHTQFVAKTGTAEAVEKIDLDSQTGKQIVKHVWFAGISFEPSSSSTQLDYTKPELVIIIYLRFGNFGKEGAPLATQILKKWREIRAKYN